MAANPEKPSGERTIGFVPCPACREGGESCSLCDGGKLVAVDVAIRWTVEHGSQPSLPPPPQKEEPSEADRLLLSAIASVVEKLAAATGLADTEEAGNLAERARALRGTVEDWQEAEPSSDERDDITRKVLGLHVALSKLLRGEK